MPRFTAPPRSPIHPMHCACAKCTPRRPAPCLICEILSATAALLGITTRAR